MHICTCATVSTVHTSQLLSLVHHVLCLDKACLVCTDLSFILEHAKGQVQKSLPSWYAAANKSACLHLNGTSMLDPRLALSLWLPVHTGLLASMWSALRCGMRSSSKTQKGIMSKSCRSLAEHYSLWKLMLSLLAIEVLSAFMAGAFSQASGHQLGLKVDLCCT